MYKIILPIEETVLISISITQINGLVEDCSNSSGLAMELQQSCT